MIDAHCHISANDSCIREILIGRDAKGIHPWEANNCASVEFLRESLTVNPHLLVGEIGLDRLKTRQVSGKMRDVFIAQLKLASAFHRPTILHGAKCWGDVVKTIKPYVGEIPAFLFHGFSRSDGLIPEIVKVNGFISVGPAILNNHAVNYHALCKKIPSDRLLVETDRTGEISFSIKDVLMKLADLRAMTFEQLEKLTDENAKVFLI